MKQQTFRIRKLAGMGRNGHRQCDLKMSVYSLEGWPKILGKRQPHNRLIVSDFSPCGDGSPMLIKKGRNFSIKKASMRLEDGKIIHNPPKALGTVMGTYREREGV